MRDVKFSDIKVLVEFMYKGEINIDHVSVTISYKRFSVASDFRIALSISRETPEKVILERKGVTEEKESFFKLSYLMKNENNVKNERKRERMREGMKDKGKG